MPQSAEGFVSRTLRGSSRSGETDAPASAEESGLGSFPHQPAHETVGIHLLSVFPLTGMSEFARVSCVPVMHVPTPCAAPFCVSRTELRTLLARIMPPARVDSVLATVDGKSEVQLTIQDDDARALGFMARIM